MSVPSNSGINLSVTGLPPPPPPTGINLSVSGLPLPSSGLPPAVSTLGAPSAFPRTSGPVVPTAAIIPIAAPVPAPLPAPVPAPVNELSDPTAPLTLEMRIINYLGLLNITLTPEQFLSDISKKNSEPDLIDYRDYLPIFPDADIRFGSNYLARGSYGRVKNVTSPQGGVLKYLSFINNQPQTKFEVREIIKETFIQYILNTDEKYTIYIPKLFRVYKKYVVVLDSSGAPVNLIYIYTHMQKADNIIYNVINTFLNSYTVFKSLIKSLIILLQHLNMDYGFAHRDLKTNNIAIMPGNVIGLIDFGYSTIRINYNGTNYKITGGNYNYSTRPNIKQDLGVLFIQMFDNYYDNIRNKYVKLFFFSLFPDKLANPLIMEVYRRQRMGHLNSLFHGAYNWNGSLYGSRLADGITIENINMILTNIDDLIERRIPIGSLVLGGKRTIRQRKKTIRQRKRTIRRRNRTK